MEDIRQKLISQAKNLGIKVTAEQSEKFQVYMETLLELSLIHI